MKVLKFWYQRLLGHPVHKTKKSRSEILFPHTTAPTGFNEKSAFGFFCVVFKKIIKNLCRNEMFQEVYITAQNINLILYTTSDVTETDSAKTTPWSKDLFILEIVQPYVLISNENSYTVQVLNFLLIDHLF